MNAESETVTGNSESQFPRAWCDAVRHKWTNSAKIFNLNEAKQSKPAFSEAENCDFCPTTDWKGGGGVLLHQGNSECVVFNQHPDIKTESHLKLISKYPLPFPPSHLPLFQTVETTEPRRDSKVEANANVGTDGGETLLLPPHFPPKPAVCLTFWTIWPNFPRRRTNRTSDHFGRGDTRQRFSSLCFVDFLLQRRAAFEFLLNALAKKKKR